MTFSTEHIKDTVNSISISTIPDLYFCYVWSTCTSTIVHNTPHTAVTVQHKTLYNKYLYAVCQNLACNVQSNRSVTSVGPGGRPPTKILAPTWLGAIYGSNLEFEFS